MSIMRITFCLKQKGATEIPIKAATVSAIRNVPVDSGLQFSSPIVMLSGSPANRSSSSALNFKMSWAALFTEQFGSLLHPGYHFLPEHYVESKVDTQSKKPDETKMNEMTIKNQKTHQNPIQFRRP